MRMRAWLVAGVMGWATLGTLGCGGNQESPAPPPGVDTSTPEIKIEDIPAGDDAKSGAQGDQESVAPAPPAPPSADGAGGAGDPLPPDPTR